MTATEVNKKLRELQKRWYEKLPNNFQIDEKSSYNKFSSPFCCGVAESEWGSEKKIIMLVGEEARNWWFDYCNHSEFCKDPEYLQKYAIEYFERQFDKEFNPEENGLHKEYQCRTNYPKCPFNENNEIKTNCTCNCTNPFEKTNSSPFWKLIKLLKQNNYSVCWNNLDKLHAIKYKFNGYDMIRETKVLNFKQERALHRVLISDVSDERLHEKTLLLHEIQVISPDYIIFLGKAYEKSIKEALMLYSEEFNPKPEVKNGSPVVDITEICKLDGVKRVLWMCHPAALNKNGNKLLESTVTQICEILKEN